GKGPPTAFRSAGAGFIRVAGARRAAFGFGQIAARRGAPRLDVSRSAALVSLWPRLIERRSAVDVKDVYPAFYAGWRTVVALREGRAHSAGLLEMANAGSPQDGRVANRSGDVVRLRPRRADPRVCAPD